MNWKMLGFLMVLLAGISFAATYSDAYMEKNYKFQLCKINYGEALVSAATGYDPTPEQEILLDSYFAAFSNDRTALSSATSRKGLTSLIRASNYNLQKANALYYRLAYPFMKKYGVTSRNIVLQDRKTASEEYAFCRFCVARPTDPKCACNILEGSEKTELNIMDIVSYEAPGEWEPLTDYNYFEGYSSESANPFQNTVGGYITAWEGPGFASTEYYHMGGEQVPRFVDASVESGPYWGKERQDLWNFANEDGSQSGTVAYTAIFNVNGQHGIPLCTEGYDESWSSCGDADKLTSVRTKIKFKGEDWVITGISGISGGVPQDVSDGETFYVPGARLALAKESSYGIVNEGGAIPAQDGYSVRLDYLSMESSEGGGHPATVALLDNHGAEVCSETLYPGETIEDMCGGTGVALHLYQAAPGLVFIARWAQMAVLSDQIELESGSSGIYMGFTNSGDAAGGDDPDNLREIISMGSRDEWEGNPILQDDLENTYSLSLSEGEMLTLPSGATVEVRSIGQNVVQSGQNCIVSDETAVLGIMDSQGEEYEYVLQEGEGLSLSNNKGSLDVEVGEISLQFKTTP